ncbi:MAG: TIGR00159 family protein [Saprospiraceae bacterium]|nr:TIGR00159 family protein [Saprospiraceae bacterium]
MDLSFLRISLFDVIDILVVGYLIYQVYRILRGSIAFNIFVGVMMLYMSWWLVRALKMDLLTLILEQFVNVGFIVIAIIFQPELRRFLLLIGNQTLRRRFNFLKPENNNTDNQKVVKELATTIKELAESQTGAIIVLANNSTMAQYSESGVVLEAQISKPLIISIFNKESPMHDGAVIISDNRIHAASCVLPLSESPSLPPEAGLRHRAAVGITESANVTAFIVSEESGQIAMAHQGELKMDLNAEELAILLEKHF